MHVLKNWQLSESLENINDVIDEACQKEILNEHEKKYVKSFEVDALDESRKLMKMVSYYGDQLQTFLDILNKTGNGQLAGRISEKKSEFVFMIKRKQCLNAEGRQNHCSLLSCNIPTQFIYESTFEGVIDKIKEKYEWRKPIADRVYVVIVCDSYIYENDEDIVFTEEMKISSKYFIHEISNIFDKCKEIKIIVIADATTEDLKLKDVYSRLETTDMYIIAKQKNEELKDFKNGNMMDSLKKIPKKKMILYGSYMHIIMTNGCRRDIESKLQNRIKHIKVGSTKLNKQHEVDFCENIKKRYLTPEIKKFIIFFTDQFCNRDVDLDNIKKLLGCFSNSKEIDIVIQNDKFGIPEESDLNKEQHKSFYRMNREKLKSFMTGEKELSVDNFLSEYCSKIGNVTEQ